jgi:hypothetical protein
MKRKKIEKLADIISEKLKDELYNGTTKAAEDYITKAAEDYTTKADSETFNKFEKIVNNLLNYDVSVNIDGGYLGIYIHDIKSIKTQSLIEKPTSVGKSGKIDEEDRLEISINKNRFTINIGYNQRSSFLYEGVYDHFYEKFVKYLDNKNNKNFSETYNVLMKESGLLRDENLENLLKEEV